MGRGGGPAVFAAVVKTRNLKALEYVREDQWQTFVREESTGEVETALCFLSVITPTCAGQKNHNRSQYDVISKVGLHWVRFTSFEKRHNEDSLCMNLKHPHYHRL